MSPDVVCSWSRAACWSAASFCCAADAAARWVCRNTPEHHCHAQGHVGGCHGEHQAVVATAAHRTATEGLVTNLELLLLGHSSHLLPAELLRYHQIAGLPAESLDALTVSWSSSIAVAWHAGQQSLTLECWEGRELTAVASC